MATPAAARTLLVGGQAAYPSLAAAVRAARPHDTIRLAAGVYHECAVLTQDGLVLEGAGAGVSVIAGVACEAKAALVTRGAGITVRGLTLASVRVPAGNGAGIRAEGADLVVAHVRFTENENGILSAPSAGSTITVSDSEFLDGPPRLSPGMAFKVRNGKPKVPEQEDFRQTFAKDPAVTPKDRKRWKGLL